MYIASNTGDSSASAASTIFLIARSGCVFGTRSSGDIRHNIDDCFGFVAFQPDGTPSFATIRDTGVERATAITMNQNPIEWKSVSEDALVCRVSSRWARRAERRLRASV